jgi:SAM-dependent methyltransferase
VFSAIKSSVPYIVFRRHNKALKRLIKLPRYLGTSCTCPICGVGLNAFKPMWKSYGRDVERFGYIHRNAELETMNLKAMTCPKCDATDRERLMAIYLDEAWPKFGGKTVRLMDFAPAWPLSQKIQRLPGVDYRSADLSRRDVQENVDLTDTGYPDASVDVFICSHILEHIPEDRKAMRELVRILKPGGFGLMLVPLVVGVEDTTEEPPGGAPVEYRWKHFGMGDHVRQYGRRDFVNRLKASGFAVEPLGADHFGRETFRKHGIAENSVLYVVRRANGA